MNPPYSFRLPGSATQSHAFGNLSKREGGNTLKKQGS